MVRFFLNGDAVTIRDVSPETTLLEWLRGAGRCGTKEGCAEGDCGACTVAVLDVTASGRRWRAVDACLVLVPQLEGLSVVTVEGLARGAALHPAQQAVVERLGSQCGYCTPGVVMSLFEATYRSDVASSEARDDQICGNLCRCTGYRPIREALDDVAGLDPEDAFRAARAQAEAQPARAGAGARFAQPDTWDGLWAALARWPDARLVHGATDVGLEVTKQHRVFPAVVSLQALPELDALRDQGGGWSIGAGVRLSDLEAASAERLPVLARMLRYFGARQIKNRATVGGNLCNASPIGDLAPVFLALDATVLVRSARGDRRVPMDAFFVGYRKTALAPGEVLVAVEVPDPPPSARCAAYKVSKRRELDISAVSAAFRVEVVDGVVTGARLAFGGMAATPVRAFAAEAALVGAPWTPEGAAAAAAALSALSPIDDHRASAWYRSTVARNLLIGFAEEGEGPLPPRHAGTLAVGGAP